MAPLPSVPRHGNRWCMGSCEQSAPDSHNKLILLLDFIECGPALHVWGCRNTLESARVRSQRRTWLWASCMWKASCLIILHLHRSNHPFYPLYLQMWERVCKELEARSSFWLLAYSLYLCWEGAARCVTHFSQHLPKVPKPQWTLCTPNVSITHLRGYIAVVWAPPLGLSFELHQSTTSTRVKCYFGITKKSWLTGRWEKRQ